MFIFYHFNPFSDKAWSGPASSRGLNEYLITSLNEEQSGLRVTTSSGTKMPDCAKHSLKRSWTYHN